MSLWENSGNELKHEESVSGFTARLPTNWHDLHGNDWKIRDAKAQRIFLRILFTKNKPQQLLKNISSDFEPDTVEYFTSKMRRTKVKRSMKSKMPKFGTTLPAASSLSNSVSRTRYLRPMRRSQPDNVPPSRSS